MGAIFVGVVFWCVVLYFVLPKLARFAAGHPELLKLGANAIKNRLSK